MESQRTYLTLEPSDHTKLQPQSCIFFKINLIGKIKIQITVHKYPFHGIFKQLRGNQSKAVFRTLSSSDTLLALHLQLHIKLNLP